MTEPANGTRYRLENLEKQMDEVRRDLHDTSEDSRRRAHDLKSEIAAANLMASQVPQNVKRLDRIERLIDEQFAPLPTAVERLDDDVRGLRKALYTLALSVTGSAVVFAITSLVLR